MRFALASSVLLSIALFVVVAPAAAQGPARAAVDSLRLSAAQADALRLDPRQRQMALQASATELRLRNIAAERLPALTGNGQAQYQSAVTKIAIPFPGLAIPVPPHDTYDAHLEARQSLFDPTIAPRRAVERAQLTETQAQIRATLLPTRQEVNDAFFSALADQVREREMEAAIRDLGARLRETALRVREGAALPADTASLAASLLQRRQDQLQLRADRAASLARLSDLVRRVLPESTTLVVPDLAAPAAAAQRSLDQLRARPEYAQFSATRARLAEQEAVEGAQEKPRLSAFGRVGYGRPGLNMLSTTFQSYWLTGVQVQWTPWTWGTVTRDREALEIQRDIVATNEQAFTESLHRGVQQAIAAIARLDSTVTIDDRIIALRESVDRETLAKLREGAVTAAEYADRYSDLVTARLARSQHVVELARARANLLTTLGVELP